MATKKSRARVATSLATSLAAFLLFWQAGQTADADDMAFLHYLGGSVYADDSNLLEITGNPGYSYDKSFLDFPGGPAYTGETFLGFDGHLENRSTGRPIPNALVILVGMGLPLQTRTDSNGSLHASSTSPAEHIRVVIKAAGYQPYSIIVFRSQAKFSYGQNVMPIFLLTPLSLSPVGSDKERGAANRKRSSSMTTVPSVSGRTEKTGAFAVGMIME